MYVPTNRRLHGYNPCRRNSNSNHAMPRPKIWASACNKKQAQVPKVQWDSWEPPTSWREGSKSTKGSSQEILTSMSLRKVTSSFSRSTMVLIHMLPEDAELKHLVWFVCQLQLTWSHFEVLSHWRSHHEIWWHHVYISEQAKRQRQVKRVEQQSWYRDSKTLGNRTRMPTEVLRQLTRSGFLSTADLAKTLLLTCKGYRIDLGRDYVYEYLCKFRWRKITKLPPSLIADRGYFWLFRNLSRGLHESPGEPSNTKPPPAFD